MRAVLNVLIVLAPLAVGCVSGSSEETARPHAETATATRTEAHQVIVAMVGDDSRSAATALVPRPTIADIRAILEIIAANGGEFGWTSICSDSRQPLLRVRFEKAPTSEPLPALPENVFLREEVEVEIRAMRARNTARQQKWEARTDQGVTDYLAEIEPRLRREATCGHSDVWGAIRRAGLMLAEPFDAGEGSHTPVLILLVASDGDDNVHRPPVRLAPGVHTLIVNGTGTVGDLTDLNAVAFEALDASILHIGRLAQE